MIAEQGGPKNIVCKFEVLEAVVGEEPHVSGPHQHTTVMT
jgi:hypothetical protein